MIISAWNGLRLCQLLYSYYFGKALPPIPSNLGPFDVITLSFTLELFALDTIPEVLAECRRVLRQGGRLGVVSMATVAPGENESMVERTYVWMHTHFPHIVDCQPIPLESLLSAAGFKLTKLEQVDLFTMPVAIAVAH
jgi:ubiquinone/menaquinone biosynthesis C-methylase UbiE